jgi:hypothetical protein
VLGYVYLCCCCETQHHLGALLYVSEAAGRTRRAAAAKEAGRRAGAAERDGCLLVSARNMGNAEPRAEEPRPYHEACADWLQAPLLNPLHAFPRRASSKRSISFHLQAPCACSSAYSIPIRGPHLTAFPPLVRNLPSLRPTSPTLDALASPSTSRRLLTPHVYAPSAHPAPMSVLLTPSNHASCCRFRYTLPLNTAHHVMREYTSFIKRPTRKQTAALTR